MKEQIILTSETDSILMPEDLPAEIRQAVIAQFEKKYGKIILD